MTTTIAQSARQRAFLSPAGKHPFSATATRAPLPREAFPQPWVANLAQHVEPRTISEGQTVGLMLIGLLVSAALFLVLFSGCKQRAEPAPATDPERFDRLYIAFFDKEVMPLAKRDGLTHTSGGCDASGSDLLCVECFEPGGESWVRCDDHGCASADTSADLATVGADVGVCERWEARNGLAVSFERRPH